MRREFAESSAEYLQFQRNIFAALSILLAVTIVLLSSLLFLKRERIIIAPPIVEKEFWVDSKSVSPTYLEQFGYFLGQLLLGKSSYSAPTQRNMILRHTDPAFVGGLKQKLLQEEEMLQKQNASYIFFPVSLQVNPEKREVMLEGDRLFFVNGKQVSSEREGYILSFNFSGSRLLLSGITSSANRREVCAK
jgi:conjugal transfer pilus assembly protein TraE